MRYISRKIAGLRKSAGYFSTSVVLALGSAGLVVGGNGCSSGYQHKDLSRSPNREFILEQANNLADSTNPEDWRTAAKYYGSIGMLDEMDICARRYAGEEPRIGKHTLDLADDIRIFYGK